MNASPFAYCKYACISVRAYPSDASEQVTQLLFGETVEICEQKDQWFYVRCVSDDYLGWIDGKQVATLSETEFVVWQEKKSFQWDVLSELITPWGRQQILCGAQITFSENDTFHIGNARFIYQPLQKNILPLSKNTTLSQIATAYLNAPYLWGGKTHFGIDCSGLVQMSLRFLNIFVPRDAVQQAECGRAVDFFDRKSNDIAFFQNKNGKIVHVGILLDATNIIHASGCVHIATYDQRGICNLEGKYTHHFAFIKRLLD